MSVFVACKARHLTMARRKATVVRRTTTSLSRLMKSGESIILVEVVV